jgi:DNA-binding response OmpR family regulator
MKKIVIIEDDKVTQFLLRNLFKDAGYSVLSIMDGREIASNKELLEADLIILDMMIPHIYESSELINIYKDLETPIIVISSIDKEDGMYFTKQINAHLFIEKPLDPDALLKEVDSILNEQIKNINVNQNI